MERRNIVVVGGSAGASQVLQTVFAGLPADLPANLFVVTHFQAGGPESLKDLLAPTSALPINVAVDGQPVEPGRITLAAADRHLVLAAGVVRLGRGPRENLMRPAIDPLFRSAALVYGPRVIGLVLSGYLDDGAAGLAAIKARGGTTLVQHPLDARVPAMPEAALSNAEIDRVLHVDEIAAAIDELVRTPAPAFKAPPDQALELEVRIAIGSRLGAEALKAVAEPTALTCPTCHGVLSEMKTGPLRFRCQTGHAFSPETTVAAQQEDADDALFIALRMMEERVTLISRMAKDSRRQGRKAIAEIYERRAEEYGRYAATLREATARTLMPEPSET